MKLWLLRTVGVVAVGLGSALLHGPAVAGEAVLSAVRFQTPTSVQLSAGVTLVTIRITNDGNKTAYTSAELTAPSNYRAAYDVTSVNPGATKTIELPVVSVDALSGYSIKVGTDVSGRWEYSTQSVDFLRASTSSSDGSSSAGSASALSKAVEGLKTANLFIEELIAKIRLLEVDVINEQMRADDLAKQNQSLKSKLRKVCSSKPRPKYC